MSFQYISFSWNTVEGAHDRRVDGGINKIIFYIKNIETNRRVSLITKIYI